MRSARPAALALLLIVAGLLGGQLGSAAGGNTVYLPLVTRAPEARRIVNAPLFSGDVTFTESAVFWFGTISPSRNYADVRVGYNAQELYVAVTAFDRRVWYDTTPSPADLNSWDGATLYLSTAAAPGSGPDSHAFRIDGQVNNGGTSASSWATYQGSGAGWTAVALPISESAGWRGTKINDDTDDRGWVVIYHVPFSALGLAGAPASGATWRMAIAMHDRDSLAGPAEPDELWPEHAAADQPGTWGTLRFGLPTFTPPPVSATSTVTIRHGLNGAAVPDAGVGGGAGCGDGLELWSQWPNTSDVSNSVANVQNQSDMADWPCFSKFYITFPLDQLPSGAQVVSASLVLHQMGGSGTASNGQPPPSTLVQVMVEDEPWSPSALTWNSAPLASENVARAWVDPVVGCGAPSGIAWPCVPRTWDVSRAVAEAHAAGHPLRLVLYSADSDYSTGKYFTTADTGDWNASGRPTLVVQVAAP